tara:strand:- start:221 stop:343 length:123 start_codon:yes stop_codon:yes gene_type:complete
MSESLSPIGMSLLDRYKNEHIGRTMEGKSTSLFLSQIRNF